MKTIECGDIVKWNGKWGEVLQTFLDKEAVVRFDANEAGGLYSQNSLTLVCKRQDRKDSF